MTGRLQGWFARQSPAVKLMVAVPLLAAALVWSFTPSGSGTPALAPSRPATHAAELAPRDVATGTVAASATLVPHQEPRPAETGLSWGTVLRTLASLAVVLGLIVLSARGLKHFVSTTTQAPGSSTSVRVLETTFVPAPSGRGRSALHLIEVGERLLLVGATDQQLSLLAEFEDDASHKLRLKPQRPGVQPADGAFEEVLAAAAEKAPPVRAPQDGELSEMLRRLRESTRRLGGSA